MLTADEVQKYVEESLQSMQQGYDEQIKELKDKNKSLEEKAEAYEKEIKDLREKLISSKSNKEDKEVLEAIKDENKKIKEQLSTTVSRCQSALMDVSSYKAKLEQKDQEKAQMQFENKKLKEEYEKKLKDAQEKYNILQNQLFLLQKKLDSHKDDAEGIKDKIEEKEKEIEKLKQEIEKKKKKIKESESTNNTLLEFVKKTEEKEEQLKKEREEMKLEREKFNLINQEMIKKKNEEKKKTELEMLMKNEIEEQKKKNLNFEEQEKIIVDLLCEYLLKLNNLQYFISLFDLIENALNHYDQLKTIQKFNITKHESMNDILYAFFESLKSYFSVSTNPSLNDFLIQKTFKLTEIGEGEVEIIKTINSLKFSNEYNIIDIYRKKRELFFKSKEFSFNVLRDKIISDDNNKKENLCEFLKISKAPLELNINLNETINQDYILVKYQVHNIFSKLRELTIQLTNIPVYLIYTLIINCNHLNVLKLIYIKDETSEEKNKDNIDKLNDICPKLVNYLKSLNSFSLINLPFLSSKLPTFIESLKLSKIKKLRLNNCFEKKEDISIFNPYFSQNILSEIDLSNHTINIPMNINNSLLNYDINNKLTAIHFSSCKLNEEDIKAISNYIVLSTSILLCDISKNNLSQLSCSTFGYCILKTTSLENLLINECGITAENISLILNGKGSKPLKHVNLNGNEFGDIGFIRVSGFLKNSPNLESIEIEKCGGTDMGFNSLVTTIKVNNNTKIKYVNFHKNNITNNSLNILKTNNSIFTGRKIVFALDKIEGLDNTDIDCAIFN